MTSHDAAKRENAVIEIGALIFGQHQKQHYAHKRHCSCMNDEQSRKPVNFHKRQAEPGIEREGHAEECAPQSHRRCTAFI